MEMTTTHVDGIAGIAVPHQMPARFVYDGEDVDVDDLHSFFSTETDDDLDHIRRRVAGKCHQAFRVGALLDELKYSRS